ncbi:MAG: hypothetical protein KC560_01220 [Myxococcales bacterium]|nr:hypothetical protein [Myxococcales bacterium]
MTRAWETVDGVATARGRLELRRRADGDFLIALAGRVLMNSRQSRSEEALGRLAAELACERAPAPRVLIGGLGMGCTLRAALDALPAGARVAVAELTERIVDWCRGPLAPVSSGAVLDPRVAIEIVDVAARIARAAASPDERFDAIALDLDEGPHHGRGARQHPVYGERALRTTARALTPGGAFVLWSEHRDAGFEARLRGAGMTFEIRRPGRGGLRHAVYVARARSGGGQR